MNKKTYADEIRRLGKIGLVANNPVRTAKKSTANENYGCSCGGCGGCGGSSC